VATISDRKCAAEARFRSEILTAGPENIRFATTAPPRHYRARADALASLGALIGCPPS
jgi:hypothetical protein